jgi:hypothetical protein
MRISDIEAVEEPEETARHIRNIMEFGHDRFETKHQSKEGKIIDVEVSVNGAAIGSVARFCWPVLPAQGWAELPMPEAAEIPPSGIRPRFGHRLG